MIVEIFILFLFANQLICSFTFPFINLTDRKHTKTLEVLNNILHSDNLGKNCFYISGINHEKKNYEDIEGNYHKIEYIKTLYLKKQKNSDVINFCPDSNEDLFVFTEKISRSGVFDMCLSVETTQDKNLGDKEILKLFYGENIFIKGIDVTHYKECVDHQYIYPMVYRNNFVEKLDNYWDF